MNRSNNIFRVHEGFAGSTLVVLLIALLLPLGCGGGSSSSATAAAVTTASGTVKTPSGQGLAGATVYLVPATMVDTTTILNATVLDGEAEAYDEPLEDLANATGVQSTVANAGGGFSFANIGQGDYFVWAQPAVGDTEYLPGGDISRNAYSSTTLANQGINITVSSSPSASATYIGTSTCLVCHTDYEDHKLTAHALGIRETGVDSGHQDRSKFPDFDDGLENFLDAADYTGGTVLYYEDFDSTRGFDKFKVFEGATGGGTVYFNAYLWKDTADDKYKITLVNIINGTDPNMLLPVKMTYGGAVYKQRHLVGITDRLGHYPFLQYQHAGSESHYDRSRKQWRDYHADWYWDDTNQEFKAPDVSKTFEANCASCHFTGYTTWQDSGTSEWLADAVNDANGVDFDGDTYREEINVGCEVCHGPGSEHQTANAARYIVNPENLTPSRANQICGQCHDRVKGNGSNVNDQPLNSSDLMMRPGTSRADFLANHTTRKTAAASSLWDEIDAVHSKSHHQQFSDLLKSKHYRNDRRLVVCADCHDLHYAEHSHQLRYSLSPDSDLCQQCHAIDVTDHMLEEIGTTMSGSVTPCVSCHMPKTAKTGAGEYGVLLGTPTGASTDENIVYWENDVTSHVFAVPSRFTAMGKTPGSAMPTPYTNECGICHTAGQLQYLDPMESETCGNCHLEEYNEWNSSHHADLVTSVTGTTSSYYASSCFKCHIGQQFIQERIAGDSSYSGSLPYSDPMASTCTVCHYPHYGSALADHQLRATGKALVPEDSTYVQANNARLCIMCHNSRTSDPESEATAVWDSGDARWELDGTPHSGNQSETFLGIGAVTSYSSGGFDESLVSDTFHATQQFIAPGQTETQMCLTCHMHSSNNNAGHDWEPVIESCAQCHSDDSDWGEWGGAASASFERPARGDYDGDGSTESIEDEYHGLLDRILGALTDGTGSGIGSGIGFTWLGGHPYWNLGTDEFTTPDADAAMVAYNYVLFEHDMAAGYHNPAYAIQVLRKSWKMLGRQLLSNPTWQPPGADW
jgi:hypothetical protein